MKKTIILILIGAGVVVGLCIWVTQSLRNDHLLEAHVTAFYKFKGKVPTSKAELMSFEQQMSLPQVASSFRRIECTEPSAGTVRIVSASGLILRSSGEKTVLVGKIRDANKVPEDTARKLADPQH